MPWNRDLIIDVFRKKYKLHASCTVQCFPGVFRNLLFHEHVAWASSWYHKSLGRSTIMPCMICMLYSMNIWYLIDKNNSSEQSQYKLPLAQW